MTAGVVDRGALRTAVHGDNWSSPWFFLHRGGQPLELDDWSIRAETRAGWADKPLFSWTVEGGGIVFGVATVRLPKTDARISLTGLQLRLRPQDWTDQPRRWRGYLEVELTHGDGENPIDRHTPVRRRPFTIAPDSIR